MKRILTAAQMKQADRNTIETMGVPSLVLMERAALSCVEELQNGTWDTGKVLAVCGPGNNGGDGAAIARILKTKGVDAELFCLGNPEKYSEGMRAQKKIAENYGVREVKNPDFREYTVIIDAIFGIGVSRSLAGEYRRAVEAICASGVPVLAVDIPSGIHTDTGEVLDAAVKARATVTFACAKPGLCSLQIFWHRDRRKQLWLYCQLESRQGAERTESQFGDHQQNLRHFDLRH